MERGAGHAPGHADLADDVPAADARAGLDPVTAVVGVDRVEFVGVLQDDDFPIPAQRPAECDAPVSGRANRGTDRRGQVDAVMEIALARPEAGRQPSAQRPTENPFGLDRRRGAGAPRTGSARRPPAAASRCPRGQAQALAGTDAVRVPNVVEPGEFPVRNAVGLADPGQRLTGAHRVDSVAPGTPRHADPYAQADAKDRCPPTPHGSFPFRLVHPADWPASPPAPLSNPAAERVKKIRPVQTGAALRPRRRPSGGSAGRIPTWRRCPSRSAASLRPPARRSAQTREPASLRDRSRRGAAR